jgi:hypothetical protein
VQHAKRRSCRIPILAGQSVSKRDPRGIRNRSRFGRTAPRRSEADGARTVPIQFGNNAGDVHVGSSLLRSSRPCRAAARSEKFKLSTLADYRERASPSSLALPKLLIDGAVKRLKHIESNGRIHLVLGTPFGGSPSGSSTRQHQHRMDYGFRHNSQPGDEIPLIILLIFVENGRPDRPITRKSIVAEARTNQPTAASRS